MLSIKRGNLLLFNDFFCARRFSDQAKKQKLLSPHEQTIKLGKRDLVPSRNYPPPPEGLPVRAE